MLTRKQSVFLLFPFVGIVALFVLLPALCGLAASFTNYAPFQENVRFVGLENYTRILQDSSFQSSVRNVLVFSIVTVVLELTLGIGLAYLLRVGFRGRTLVRFLLLTPWLISPIASGIMWHFVAGVIHGLPNYLVALLGFPDLPFPFTMEWAMPTAIATEIWRQVPLVIFLLIPGILTIPQEHWDQAKLDGATAFRQIRSIMLPHVRLLLLTITLLLIGNALGTFETILMLTGGGPGTATLTFGFYSYRRAFSAYDWVGAATSGWFIVATVGLVGVCYIVLVHRWGEQLQ